MTDEQDFEALIWKPWFVQPNDLIGGFCIMAEDKPPSESQLIVADFTSEFHARHMVRLHNDHLRKHGSPEEGNNDNI